MTKAADVHDVPVGAPHHVAPTTARELNTIRLPLVPIACWRMDDVRFDFDSSFLRPEAKREISELVALLRAHEKAPASIFGHADPVGNDAYNKTLSGRRAVAIHALLVRDTGAWEELYQEPFGGDDWKKTAVAAMIGALGFDSIESFQGANGLKVDGDAGPLTRAKLFRAYMDFLCEDMVLTREDFLGSGADRKAACQGCSELNPVLLASKKEKLTKDERDAKNAPNRRVLLYLFRPGTRVSPQAWPCPTTDEGIEGCKKMLWPDQAQRRAPGDEERHYAKTKDTMGCRFYEALARRSPCEGVTSRFTAIRVRLFDGARQAMPRAQYRLTVGQQVRHGVADRDAFVVARAIEVPNDVILEWGQDDGPHEKNKDDPFLFRRKIYVGAQDAIQRLHNMGYSESRPQEENVRAFQRDRGMVENGTLDAATEAEIERAHQAMMVT